MPPFTVDSFNSRPPVEVLSADCAAQRHRKIARHIAAHRRRAHIRVEPARKRQIDAPVYRAELQRIAPRRHPHRRVDRPVHRAGVNQAARAHLDVAVHAGRVHVRAQRYRRDAAIHRPRREMNARRNLHGKIHHHVVITALGIPAAMPALAIAASIVARVHRADRHAVGRRRNLDPHAGRIAPARGFPRRHFDYIPRGPLRTNRAVDILNFECLPRLQRSGPGKISLKSKRRPWQGGSHNRKSNMAHVLLLGMQYRAG